MTDSHDMSKENSTVALNQPRRSSTSTVNATITIKDDTDNNVSDNDAQSVLNASEIHVTVRSPWKNGTASQRDLGSARRSSLKSPWKDETLRSDLSSEEDSMAFTFACATPNVGSKNAKKKKRKKRNATACQSVLHKVPMMKSPPMTERTMRKQINESPLRKSSSRSKSSKYHWSGTFRSSKNLFHGDARYSPYLENKGDQLPACYYNREDYARGFTEKFTADGDVHYPNAFDSRTNDSDGTHKERIGWQSYIDTCTNEYDGPDNIKDYDSVLLNDGSGLPEATFDININFESRLTDMDNEDNDTCRIDSRANERDNANVSLHSPFVRDFASSSALSPRIKLNGRKLMGKVEEKSNARSRCYEAWCLLLSFFKNLFLFSLLPAAYITFFIYVQGTEN